MSIEVPPTPATADEAVRLSNIMAYGFDKNTLDYWGPHYNDDRDYYWKRMLGWEAGGADVAKFGLYAEPPTPWAGAVVVPTPTPDPTPTPTSPYDIQKDVAALKLIIYEAGARLSRIEDKLNNPPAYQTYVAGSRVILTPIKDV